VIVPIADMGRRGIVELGGVIAREKEGAITLLNIVEIPPNTPTTAIHYRDVRDQIRDMERVEHYARKFNTDVDARLQISHQVAPTINDIARSEEANLIIMGWKGLSRIGSILGVNIDEVVSGFKGDVVVYKAGAPEPQVRQLTLLFEPGAHVDAAAELVAPYAKHHGAAVTILIVSDTDALTKTDRDSLAKLRQVFETRGLQVTVRPTKHADFVKGVIKETEGTDLLVLGISDTHRVGRALFGPVHDRIAKGVKCPVLIMRKVSEARKLAKEPPEPSEMTEKTLSDEK
jgi:nucleotide-binding universal stress UspA family protein